ncbi:hypothetical protein J1N35_041871 [Gossypium stocksii]|uniref:Reverse transcriptase zinc-binding domain-containing protein n=1 Tax=Gossypium stocksii TaxID=47602 RepID=A0A9D3UGR5_9ROSI|nr:hypothetical protein J1N35_041871 [Gossypium stocksii]
MISKLKLVRGFILGSSNGSRKVALVKWISCCQPLHNGGLGLRKLMDQSKDFLLKLGFQLITKPDAVWVKVLRRKYKLEDGCPASIDQSCSSFVWRSLSKCWDILHANIYWMVGDGRSVKFWEDSSVPGMGPLVNQFAIPTYQERFSCVADYMDSSGGWAWSRFGSYIDHQTTLKIASMNPPPTIGANPDICLWRGRSDGVCTAPQRVRQFLWVALHGRLSTNTERLRRGLTTVDICQSSCFLETPLYALRACVGARDVWNQIVLNKNKDLDPRGVVQRSLCMAKWYNNSVHNSANTHDSCSSVVAWSTPPPSYGVVKINTDGALIKSSSIASAGRIFPDDKGEWILGFLQHRHYGQSSMS